MPSSDLGPTIEFGWARAAAAGLTFRAFVEADLPFIKRVYASTRADELAVVNWSDAQKTVFLDIQFRAQHEDYLRNYADADWLVIHRAAEPVGRLYLRRIAEEHSIIDIAFLPEHRGVGLGGALLSDLLDEAAAAAKPISIYVEKFNPAYRLYLRLGFQKTGDAGVYDLMRWTPS